MNASHLAGFFSAHAVWSVSDGSTLIPIYASVSAEGKPEMKRLSLERLEDGVAAGQQLLESEQAKNRVLVFDGRIPVGEEKLDALIVEWRSTSPETQQMTIAIPYTPYSDKNRFLIHRPKILNVDSESKTNLENLMNQYWQGVDQHEEGAKVWSDHLDQSK